MHSLRDERGIILNWLAKILLFLAVFGVIVFDGGSVAVNYFTLDSAANDTAVALSLAIQTDDFGTNDQQVFEAAKTLIATDETLAQDARVLRRGTHVDEQGVIHVKLRREAKTILLKRIEAVRKWGIATSEGQAGTN